MSKKFPRRVEIPLTEAQYTALKARADARFLPMTIYVRQVLAPHLTPYTPEPIPPYDVPPGPPLLQRKGRYKV